MKIADALDILETIAQTGKQTKGVVAVRTILDDYKKTKTRYKRLREEVNEVIDAKVSWGKLRM
jgi:hypothetical protein